ncbi:hypothetical protein [Rhizobium sp. AU243]|uniref:hypothetical protein n=1 Tax=Rhizobium sp. AU243 TaxID=2303425 RepID=UPI0010CB80FD|nr:hypothetical protein [Rhizobium sp. AU243]TKV76128.1 hypothetical protein D0C28_10715 [Rhizobium sp. AU243]
MANSDDEMIDKQIDAIAKELDLLKAFKNSKNPAPAGKADTYSVGISFTPGKGPVISVQPMTVVTIGCPTVSGTCMADSCYTC